MALSTSMPRSRDPMKSEPEAPDTRETCYRCMRPAVVCYCDQITPLDTETRVVLLQHPRERDVGVGTARMAHLSLPRSELRVGVDFENDSVVREALGENTYLLFPGEHAMDLAVQKPEGPITLIVVDGTWSQAKSLWRRNPVLASLPQIRFTPPEKSNYRIRREPADHCVATIEALAYVLGELEGDRERFRALLAPFRKMVDMQLAYAERERGKRSRHARPGVKRPTRMIDRLAEHPDSIVCINGEVNAWARRGQGGSRAEIVHFSATRPSTGERLDCIVAPRDNIAPLTPKHIELSASTLEAGMPWDEFVAQLHAFLREGDLLCGWGLYPIDILENEGLVLPHTKIDMRSLASAYLKRSGGAVQECAARLGAAVEPQWAPGRGGRRIAALDAVVRKLRDVALALRETRRSP